MTATGSTSEKNTNTAGCKRAANFFQNCKTPKISLEDGLTMYRKNMETIASMGKMSMDVYQNLAKLQMGFFQQMMADMNQAFQQSLTAKNMNECVSHGTEFVKDRVTKTTAHAKSVSNELSSSSTQVIDLAKSHAKEQMQSLKDQFKKAAG